MKFLNAIVFATVVYSAVVLTWDNWDNVPPHPVPYGNTEPTAIVPLVVELILISPGEVDKKPETIWK